MSGEILAASDPAVKCQTVVVARAGRDANAAYVNSCIAHLGADGAWSHSSCWITSDRAPT